MTYMYSLTGETVFFPASGYRSSGNGSLGSIGNDGYYWSSSAYAGYAYFLSLYSGGVDPADYNYRAFGRSVRCVRL
jgi:hypothetical protein